MNLPSYFYSIVEGSALITFLFVWTLKATMLLIVAGMVTHLLRRASASLKHLVWLTAFCGVLGLPLLSVILPHWGILPQISTSSLDTRASSLPGVSDKNAELDSRSATPQSQASFSNKDHHLQLDQHSAKTLGVEQLRPDSAADHTPVSSKAVSLLGSLWIIGAALILTRYVGGLVSLIRLQQTAEPMQDTHWRQYVTTWRHQTGSKIRVSLLQSSRNIMPMVWGLVRAVVLLPEQARQWTAARRKAVLLHELAHVSRRDQLAQIVVNVVCMFHWFNPMVWKARKMMWIQREHACDDFALQASDRPSGYAQEVLQVAAAYSGPATPNPTPALAMANRSSLEGRLCAILEKGRNRRRVSRRSGCCVLGVALACTLPLAALTSSSAIIETVVEEEPETPRVVEVRQQQTNSDQDAEPTGWSAETLLEALRSADRKTRLQAEADIRKMGSYHPTVDQVVDRLLIDLVSQKPSLRSQSAWQLEKTGSPRIIEPLIERLQDVEENVRAAVAGALGETKMPSAIEPLRNLSVDENERVREWSARALGNFKASEAVSALLEYMHDDSADVREWAARGLSDVHEPKVTDALIGALHDESSAVREWAARSLGDHTDKSVVDALTQTLNDESSDVREWAARSLGNIGSPDAIEALKEILDDHEPNVREWSARAIGNIGEASAAEALEELLNDENADVSEAAARSLGYLGDVESSRALESALESEHADVRDTAARSLGYLADPESVNALADALSDESEDVRQAAAQALGAFSDPTALQALGIALIDEDEDVREAAAGSLGRVGTSEAEQILMEHLEASLEDDQEYLANQIDGIQRRRDPQAYYLKKYPNEDEWIRIARVYVVKHRVNEKKALEFARKTINRRDAFLKNKKDPDAQPVREWVEKLRTEFLIKGLDEMARKSRKDGRSNKR